MAALSKSYIDTRTKSSITSLERFDFTFKMAFCAEDSIVQEMIPRFTKLFAASPLAAGRAPGRVNLIGEHIDYCGFAVFPMALEGKHTTVLVRPTCTGLIRCRNTDPDHYPDTDVPFTCPCEPLVTPLSWARYVEGAVKEYCRVAGFRLRGLDLLVHGKVPIASGLSSSAALLCAIASALDVIQGIPHEKQGLVQATVEAEHRVGMNCGGMDQSISIYGKEKPYPAIFNSAFFWSASTVFCPELLFSLPCFFIILLSYSATSWRELGSALLGIGVPYWLAGTYDFLWQDDLLVRIWDKALIFGIPGFSPDIC